MAGGRPRFGVWKHFNRVEGTKDVTCKKCFELISNAKVEKLDRHVIISCQRWTENDRNALKLSVAQERQPNASRASLDSSSSGSDSSSTSSNIALTQKRFDQLVADFIFSGGYPLRTVEKRGFAKFALEGRPAGLKIPSRRLLSTDLLDEAYDREMEKLVEALKKCPFEGMVLDGCSSVSHEKKLNFVVVAPNLKPKLWKVVPTGSNSQSGEYIANLTMKVVDEIEAAVGKVGFVAGVNTDNAKAMQRAWEILEDKRGIICAGCGAHTLNLLLQDIGKLDIIKEVVEKAVRVATYFISRHLLLARLETERSEVHNAFGHTVSLPVVTRWYSTYNSLVSVIKNREAIAGVFQDHQFMSQYKPNRKSQATPSRATRASNKRKRGSEPTQHVEATPPPAQSEYEIVEEIVQDESFWKLGKQVIKLLAPIVKAIGLLEADGCSSGMTYWCFVHLLKKAVYREPMFLADTASRIVELINDRWNFLHTDAMAIAFLLDPTKDPADFVGNDHRNALQHVREVAARLKYSDEQQQSAFHEASLFLTAKWDKKIDGGGLAPLEWWSVNRSEYLALFEIARRVFTMPTSSAAAERSWSIYKYIHSKLRNQLMSETVQKLVFIYSNRLSDDKTPEVIFNPSTLDRCDEDEDSARQFIDNSFEYQGSQD